MLQPQVSTVLVSEWAKIPLVMETPTRLFVVMAICFAVLSTVLLVQGSAIARGAGPNELNQRQPDITQATIQIDWLLGVFERQLVSDFGNAISTAGVLMGLASVLASIAAAFPALWLLGLILTTTFCAWPIFSFWWASTQMLSKRQRMQNLFNTLPETDPDAPIFAMGSTVKEIRSQRDYWLDRHPLFGQWSKLSILAKWKALMGDVRQFARLYTPVESEMVRNVP